MRTPSGRPGSPRIDFRSLTQSDFDVIAVETWDTYGHLIGDEDDRSRLVIQGALAGMANRADSTRTVDPI